VLIRVFNSAVGVLLGMVNWQYVILRPRKVEESPVVEKRPKKLDGKSSSITETANMTGPFGLPRTTDGLRSVDR
jgi:hypothetical protein